MLTGNNFAFDFEALDISKAVIFGDPDLSDDPRLVWEKLGAPEPKHWPLQRHWASPPMK